ncbi:hypothetical protein GCM10007897_05930 [Sphingobium jiangsuense]|uniref:AcrR family transcriptional regulator n=1 Tax=Sphingobium jiangsuense TaxID=870476 RepID=A0A7W6BFW2_9SPHN|nr:TetR/AcrR family transcriptional regulator [Sphingobium jiangsuense]MBB3925279.1 AcrR family transcriptional regulator [Sphingobium jiangsuense]GLS99214.1 hypothetical protein GCM10007897_05930 [Sphingobium jiangsuense]
MTSPSRADSPRRLARYSGAENRDIILDAALEVFSLHGFSGASTRQIAAAAGIEPGHLAYYFPSKAKLWRSVIEAFARKGEVLLREALDGDALDRPEESVAAILPPFLRCFAENPRLTRLMLQEFSVSGERHDWVVASFGKPVWEILRPLFERLERRGLLSGASAPAAYFNLLGGALIAFGNRDLLIDLAGFDPTGEAETEAYIRLLMRPLLQGGI